MSGESHDVYTHSDTFGITVNHYGDARGTRNQFANSDPSAIDPLINENIAAYHFATETLTPQLAAIRSRLEACWTGNSADNALAILTQLSTNASTIGTNTLACHASFVTFQSSWQQLKSKAETLYEGVAGSGVHEDNAGAHTVFHQFTDAMQTSMHSMPAHLKYQTPLDDQHAGPGPGSGPGPGPGPGGWAPGGWGPGGPGPGGWGPGGGPGPGGWGPGGGPGSHGPGYTGGNGGYQPGSGLDTGSQLASYTGGGMGPGGPGPGFGGPGPGPGPGFLVAGPGAGLSGAAGLSTAGALESEAGISGVGTRNASGGRPMMGRGGAGDDEDERDRTTWLSEEEGIWDGGSDAPPGTIA